jgi:Fe-S cluster biogenesis protein NfuA
MEGVKGSMRSRIEAALDKVRPALRADGGDAEIVECDERRRMVRIAMTGACRGCPLSQLDFVYGLERLIRQEVPDVEEILTA